MKGQPWGHRRSSAFCWKDYFPTLNSLQTDLYAHVHFTRTCEVCALFRPGSTLLRLTWAQQVKYPGEPTLSPGYSESWSCQTDLFILFWLGFFPHRDLVAPYLHILGFMADTPSLTRICLILMPATVHSLLPVTASVGSQNSLDKQPGAPGSTYAKSPRWSSRCLFWLLTWCYFFLLDILFPPLFAWLSHSCLKM